MLQQHILTCIAEGLDTEEMDGFLDQLFELAAVFGCIKCNLHGDGVLRLHSRDVLLQVGAVPRAKTKLRMLEIAIETQSSNGAPKMA